MKILIANAGSTSLKFRLWDMPGETVLAQGRVERIGMGGAIFGYDCAQRQVHIEESGLEITGYTQGIRLFLDHLTAKDTGALDSVEQVEAVGFKTVLCKGYTGVHLLDEAVLEGMRAYLSVAPAHNGPYLEAIGVFRELLPDTPLVGVFETAFHQTIPEYRRLYALPYEWIERWDLRKMGFHGASHSYVAMRTGGRGRVVSCHLGGSSSLCAILDGKSVDNSFGFSLQAGLPHNNRVGDLDPFVLLYLQRQGLTPQEIEEGLTKRAGLKGISGLSGDMRDIERAMDEGDPRARLAFDMLADGVRRLIGAYAAELGGLDQLVFTGGIGENSWRLREAVCEGVAFLGVQIDRELNRKTRADGVISAPGSKVTVRVLTAGEELMVARATFHCIGDKA